MALTDETIAIIADELFELMNSPREVDPYSVRYFGYELDDAYRVVEEMRRRREARGERVVGRKIGFTNQAAWAGYGISGPIWNYLYDTTTHDLAASSVCPLRGWPNIRMETEIAFGLGEAPEPEMDAEALLNCIDWAALDFEVCTSIFRDWRFAVADAATTGVHVALFVGERSPIAGARTKWADQFRSFGATLSNADGAAADGGGAQVLGSPIAAFGYLVREVARFGGRPMQAGDIVTTGTLTAALPSCPGETWTASVTGIPLDAISVSLTE
jgi:2-oxo-3-hexenedioate decarboxylase